MQRDSTAEVWLDCSQSVKDAYKIKNQPDVSEEERKRAEDLIEQAKGAGATAQQVATGGAVNPAAPDGAVNPAAPDGAVNPAAPDGAVNPAAPVVR